MNQGPTEVPVSLHKSDQIYNLRNNLWSEIRKVKRFNFVFQIRIQRHQSYKWDDLVITAFLKGDVTFLLRLQRESICICILGT